MAEKDTVWDDQEISPSKLNVLSVFHGTTLPATNFPVDALFYVEGDGVIYRNTGTFATPVWTLEIGLASGISLPASPAVNQPFLRTDTVILYQYITGGVGNRWDKVNHKDEGSHVFKLSNTVATPDDDFTYYTSLTIADLFWKSTDTTKDRVNLTNDNLDFNHNANSIDIAAYMPIGITISDTLWVVRFKLRFSTLTQAANAFLYLMLTSAGTVGEGGSQDFIGIRIKNISGTTNYGSVDGDGQQPSAQANDNSSTSVAWATATDYYIEIKRTSATAYTVAVYSDAGFTTVLGGGPIAGTVASTTINLRDIKIMNSNNLNAGVFTGTLDNVQLKSGTSTF